MWDSGSPQTVRNRVVENPGGNAAAYRGTLPPENDSFLARGLTV